MTDIVWETPPGRGRANLRAFADTLREHPGKWARYPNPLTGAAAASSTSRINGGQGTFRPAGSFEAVTRTVDGERVLFVRYVGATEVGAA